MWDPCLFMVKSCSKLQKNRGEIMSLESAVKDIVCEYISKKIFPGAVILAGTPEQIFFMESFGTIDGEIPSGTDTVFDLASLSKPVSTLPAVLTLIQEGKIELEDRAAKFIPIPYEGILIRHLLTHTSGMPPYSIAYKSAKNPDELMNEILNTGFATEPEKEVVYSCLNFILLMKIVDKVTGNFEEYVQKEVFEPLGMKSTCYKPKNLKNVAPTSQRDDVLLRGMPDDELAFYLGGVSGNAGLFSCAEDIYRYGSEWIQPGKVLTPSTVQLSLRHWTKNIPGDKKGLCWALHTHRSSDGAFFSNESYGHTGFTGTCLWIDPQKRRMSVILTNRCFYQRHTKKDEIWEFRRKINNVLATYMDREGLL